MECFATGRVFRAFCSLVLQYARFIPPLEWFYQQRVVKCRQITLISIFPHSKLVSTQPVIPHLLVYVFHLTVVSCCMLSCTRVSPLPYFLSYEQMPSRICRVTKTAASLFGCTYMSLVYLNKNFACIFKCDFQLNYESA